jgi:hypothetical protein
MLLQEAMAELDEATASGDPDRIAAAEAEMRRVVPLWERHERDLRQRFRAAHAATTVPMSREVADYAAKQTSRESRPRERRPSSRRRGSNRAGPDSDDPEPPWGWHPGDVGGGR